MSVSGLVKSRAVRISAALAVVVSGGLFTFTTQAQAAGETVVSLTFNDGLMSQYQHARPVLLAHNVQGTFYLSSRVVEANAPGYMATWHADALYRDGDEIGGVTTDHVDLTDPGTTQQYKIDQVCGDKQRLTTLGYDPQSFSYPFAAVNANAESIVQGCGYLSGRTVGGLDANSGPYAEQLPPADAFRLSTANFGGGQLQLADLQNAVNVAASNGGGWLPIAFNNVCDSTASDYSSCMGGYQSLDKDVLSAFIDWLQSTDAPAGTTIKRVRDVMGAAAQPPLPPRPTVVSLTFDDGDLSQYGTRTMFATHNMHGTFYINSGAVDAAEPGAMTWTQIHALQADGHDIGGHTLDHVDMTAADTSFDYRWHQACDDRARLQALGFSPASFAYPFAAFNAQAVSIIKGCGYQSGRSGGSLLVGGPLYSESIPPSEPFSFKALGTTYDGPITLQWLQDAVNGPADRAGGWVPMLFHDICYAGSANFDACMAGYRPVSDTTLSQFMDWLTANASRGISVKTVADVMGGGQTIPNPIVTAPTAGQTVSPAPTVSGSAQATGGNVTVSVYSGPYSTGTPVLTVNVGNNSGAWTTTLPGPLANGTYTVQAQQTGNGLTGFSAPRTFVVSDTVDTTPPAIVITAPVNNSSVNVTTPRISGTGGTATGDAATTTLRIYNGATATGTPRQTVSAPITAGAWGVTPASLPQGIFTAQATQTDAAGNVGTSTSTFTVDTTKPVVRITSPLNNAAITATSFTASGTTGTLTGDSATVTLKVYAGSNTTGALVKTLTSTASAGAWSAAVTDLPAGPYTLSASSTDAAGNVGVSTNVVVQLRSAMTVTSITPNAFAQGLTARAVAINGTGFTAASVPSFTGAGVTMTSYAFVSATRINAVIDTDAAAAVGRSNVVVSRPDTFAATCTNCVTVNLAPKVTGASPSTVSRGLLKSFAINGSGFTSTSQVTFSGGSGINVLLISRSANQINITTSSITGSAGVRNITVTNSDGGTSTCVGCLTIT
ncbi:polysaccharide deacetylase family protein [Kribbella ginsengisoli]|uniref:Polysaccharide deacetylase n=1 Tax=Kribbella ginsengisoli TaxID=363865 RepID=A0ABP6YEB6_9ACTN